ncbi:hypothetical protein ACP6JC_008733, partial [Aspergillus fumigatus]
KSGCKAPRSRGICPIPCAPSTTLKIPSARHASINRSNGNRTPGKLTIVSNTATRTVNPSAVALATTSRNFRTSSSWLMGNWYWTLRSCSGVVSVSETRVFSTAPYTVSKYTSTSPCLKTRLRRTVLTPVEAFLTNTHSLVGTLSSEATARRASSINWGWMCRMNGSGRASTCDWKCRRAVCTATGYVPNEPGGREGV